MRFPIDVVFLDGDNRVLKVAASVKPWKAVAARGAKAVVELSPGEAERRNVEAGDLLQIAEEPSRETRKRRLPWAKGATNMLLTVLWVAFAAANLADWRRTGRPVGLGAMVLELMVASLFFVRRDAWVTSRAPLAWTATTFGAWGMLAARPHFEPVFGLEVLWFGLQVGGALAAAVSLGVLGRSFGLVAANRGIQTSGPYRIVRHPAYAASFFADIGYTLENPSPWNVAVLALVLTFQFLRIRTEEDCLRDDDAYRRYCIRVRYRLVPGVW